MPLVRISLSETYPQDSIDSISSSVHKALMEAFHIPEDDYFHIIESLGGQSLKYPSEYLGIRHSAKIMYIQIFASKGRTLQQKELLYRRIAEHIKDSTGIPSNDIIILLTEIDGKENWSFGNGAIQNFTHI
ncbi:MULTISPECIES: tautomerase family protein [Chryseobacterium]|uniref:Phenylpyruvate tautomerase PptA (4-oxalocrotonate tautomerase family) n=1 Tax=Chryseobacterium camelliae TaxID=1265445 RepID=A0ABU0TKP5_9FLAO|nr:MULTISPECIES: tautomerase family protein [Chryseobacterium]MDT3408533.1 phenylpyruvate tautomerase PptA (4-oxalocrotonate tautomerase family) [Pseudacidovorax intermedius]MDQ1097612.1 phenylpyruvate tautomerase PptA (4-oxalocrotonate tautomerase family) [Chryseobacterium camelliae]MDQ1101541.1 phenylpyruvate tautomerase PptA (4-oxalocrotonate tautomerase family) [Chryseobacterium sp. SORGH_AS_1048]MDR6084984.1 phenylpyruvate tautomerase PptA (4-oxalocrotonate tautomerase family) [Chryseobact